MKRDDASLVNPAFQWRDTMRLELKSRDLDAFCLSEMLECRDLLDYWRDVVDAKIRTQKAMQEDESE